MLPALLFKCGKMKVLELSSNGFTGELPGALFGDMPDLEEFWVSNAQRTGSMPPSLAMCSNPKKVVAGADMVARSSDAVAVIKAAIPGVVVK